MYMACPIYSLNKLCLIQYSTPVWHFGVLRDAKSGENKYTDCFKVITELSKRR